jgi:hypothetical protein
VLGGPLGTAMAWGAFGVGVGGAASETDRYLVNQAATNTDLDPNKSVVPQDMKGHWGWVVASWVGAGLDFGAAVQATRMLKAGMEVDQAIKILSAQHKIPAEVLDAAYRTAEKGAQDPKTLQKILKSAMPEKLAAQANGLMKTPRILEPAEFAQKFGSESADAVTTFTKGKDGVTRAEVFFRKGGNPLSMREEAVHLTQLAEGGDTAKKIGMLTEENLGKWPQMATEQRLEVYKAKVEVEIDAQQQLLQQFGEGDPKYVKSVEQNLENLQARRAEVDAGVKNPKSVEGADWLEEAQAPRLFSKSGAWKWGQPNVDGIPAHPSVRQPFKQIEERLNPEEIKRIQKTYGIENENESEARAIWHILQQRDTKEVIAGEDEIKRFFGISRKENSVNMADALQIRSNGKLVPIEVKNESTITIVDGSNSLFKKFRKISEKVDVSKIEHFEVICNSKSHLEPNFRVDKLGKLEEMISGTTPPEWRVVTFGEKPVYIRYGDLGEISK